MDRESFFISLFKSKYIGDDGAVDGEVIYSSDMFFENIHFKREWMSYYQIAQKAMLVNISDSVAMGAVAKLALVNIELPKDTTKEQMVELADGFSECAKEWGIEIIGGDTIGGDKLNISITLISQTQNPLRRDGAKVGDLVAYTGKLGESLKALERLIAGESIDMNSRFIKPTLRADFIYNCREYLSAGLDISDGLYCDMNRVLNSNRCGIELFKKIPQEVGRSGEEYEMLVCFSESNIKNVMKIAESTETPLIIFGRLSNKNSFRFECKNHHF